MILHLYMIHQLQLNFNMKQAEYIHLLGTVKRLITTKKNNPIHINLGKVINIYILKLSSITVKVKTPLGTNYFELDKCDPNLLVMIRAGLQNPSFARSLHITLIDPKKILKEYINNLHN